MDSPDKNICSLEPSLLQTLDQEIMQWGKQYRLPLVHGLICALITNPDLPLSESVFEGLFWEKRAQDKEEGWQHFIKQTMLIGEETEKAFLAGRPVAPLVNYEQQYEPGAIRQDKALQENLAYWCDGYYFGTELDAGLWAEATRPIKDQAFSILIWGHLGWNIWQATKGGGKKEFIEAKKLALPCLPQKATGLYHQWREKGLLQGAPSFSQKQKAGRNELCPCGSGKKFKRCCIEA